MVLSTSDAVGAPAKAHTLDEQFSHGQSNPTYLLKANSTQYVLRKKPPGKVLASAHAVEREFQVLAALKDTPVPVPKALCLCQDAAVIGTPFYVMEHVQGRIFIEPTLPELSPPERAAAYRQQAVTLAALHSVRPEQVNLQRYGRPAGYCARQVWRWSQQYQAQLTGQALPEMMELIDWLKNHIPADDSDPSVGRISHGDYRIDNLIYAPDTTDRVLALLDWELSTLGYPLADLAYSAMCYHFPSSDKTGVRGLPRPLPEGIPSEAEYIQMYCQARGIGVPDPTTYAFCQALSMFRIAAILAGVGARAQQGNASSKHAAQVGAPEVVAGIAQRALHVIHEAAQVTHAQSHSSGSNSASNSQGAGSMGGGSSAIYSQGPSQGGTQGEDSRDSQADAGTPAMPSMSGTSTATNYADSSKHRSLSGRGEFGKGGISSNPTSSQQGSGNMGGASSAIYSQGPSKGDNGNDKKGDDDTPAMPSMSGTTTASTYSDSRQHPSLSGKGKSSPTSTSGSSAYDHPSKSAAQDKIKSNEILDKTGSDHISGVPSEGQPAGSANLGFDPPPRVQKLVAHLKQFMDEHIYLSEHILEAHAADPKTKWTIHPRMEELKAKARGEGLWNLWLPADMAAKIAHLREKVPQAERHLLIGPGLSNLEYAFLSEVMGRSAIGSEVFNCSAPDTGNMEVLSRYGSRAQQERWLLPLLQGKIRSCFAMTEPQVASSDATNIQSVIRSLACRDGDTYIVNGHKWWTSGAPDPRCKIAIFMGKTDTSATTYKQQSMILVPMDAPGVDVIRPLRVYGYDDAPHGHAEVMFKDVRVPASNMLLGEGRGFEIAQGRLGPGRLHHCMRAVGMGERALELMGKRALERVAFKKPVAQHGAFQSDYARCRIELSAACLTVLAAAHALDKHGNKKARGQIAAAKVYAPNVVLRVIDAAIQVHGGAGVCDDFPLAALWSGARTLRLADGPDDVHLVSIAKLELAKLSKL
ncbi:hypothetical protein WJX82_005473 [Trebouxia sp. C0006]